MRLVCDALVLAFHNGVFRTSMLKLNNDRASLRFPHSKLDYIIHRLLSLSDSPAWLKSTRSSVSRKLA